jgi:putative thiamine transport system permease protein
VRRRWQAEHAWRKPWATRHQRAFWRVVWPQLAPRLFWPLMAVLAYGLTVVDLALVIGPAARPRWRCWPGNGCKTRIWR